ncbi:MAG: hypothetical protein U0M02_04750 [Acutalibacteraceae bacterium]|nr:hypothetical protein [Acutalibacteraceae bacterium]
MNDKITKILCAVMAVIMVAAGVVFFVSTKNSGGSPQSENPEPVVFSYDESAYTANLSVKGANGEIYLPTDFSGIYYTADLNGSVKFYEYENGQMVASTLAVKQAKASLKASRETIPVTVNYIEKDGKACGYGIFTSDMSKDVEVYDYAFVKLTAKPAGYGSGYLLLADFDKDNLYKAEKLYSEIYNFDLANGKTSTYVSNHTRLIDSNGTFRQDWTLLTDDFINNLGGAKLFLSSRYYNEADKSLRADVMVLSNAYKPKIEVKDILGVWFVNDGNGMHYLKKNDKGFANILKTGDTENVLTQFEGDWQTDYLQCGKYLINKKSLVMIDLLTGSSKTLKDINIEKADVFSVNTDGTKAVFASYGEVNANGTPVQSITYCTVDGSAEPAVYTEPMLFSENAGFVWLDSSNVMSVRALTADGKTAGSVVYSY